LGCRDSGEVENGKGYKATILRGNNNDTAEILAIKLFNSKLKVLNQIPNEYNN
jgi:hypothetical protein